MRKQSGTKEKELRNENTDKDGGRHQSSNGDPIMETEHKVVNGMLGRSFAKEDRNDFF